MLLGVGDENAGSTADPPRCSAKGCRADATTDLSWRNPRLHDTARRKHWLACDQHAAHLADFLARRDFLIGRAPVGEQRPTGDGPGDVRESSAR